MTSRNRSRSRSPGFRVSRSERSALFLCNLPYEMNWKDIKDWFKAEVGENGYITLYEVEGRNNGVGTVEVSNPRIIDEAIEKLNGLDLRGRKIICRRETARDYEKVCGYETVGTSKNKHGYQDGSSAYTASCSITSYTLEQAGFIGPITDAVYVTNLRFDLSWQPVKDQFRRAGHVLKVEMSSDSEGKSRGFAIVRYEYQYEAVIASVMFNGQNFEGRELRVRMDKEARPADPRRPLFPPNPRGNKAAADFLSLMTRNVNSPDRREARVAATITDLMLRSGLDRRGPPPPMSYGMSMRGSRFGGPPGPRGPMDSYRGNARGDSPPVRRFEFSPERRVARRDDMERRPMASNPHVPRRLDDATENLLRAAINGGMPPEQVEKYALELGISGRDLNRFQDQELTRQEDKRTSGSARCMVRSIPEAFSDRDLEHYFAGFGELKAARICVDAQRRSLGYGFVEYFTESDARHACSRMNGYLIEGKPIRVAFG